MTAGYVNPVSGYRMISIDGNNYCSHKLVWFYINGVWPSGQIDHINQNKSDDRIEHLRPATRSQNGCNSKGRSKRGLPKWVRKHGNGFQAQLKFNGKQIPLGTFSTPEEAHEVAKAKAKELHGEFFRSK